MKTARLLLIASLVLLIGSMAIVPATAQDGMTEFVYAHSGPIRPMDAHSHWYGSTHHLLNLYYDCLIWRAADGSGYVPQAAHSWENVDDTTWRFHLREGATFHNGEPVDAEAVKWNIDRVPPSHRRHPALSAVGFRQGSCGCGRPHCRYHQQRPHAYFENDVSITAASCCRRITSKKSARKSSTAIPLAPVPTRWPNSARTIAMSSKLGTTITAAAPRLIASSTRSSPSRRRRSPHCSPARST